MSVSKSVIITLIGALGIGFLPVANAKIMWIEAKREYCPDVCQATKDYHSKHPEYNVPYAVPAGINPIATEKRGTPQIYKEISPVTDEDFR